MRLLIIISFLLLSGKAQVYLPIELKDRTNLTKIELTNIGDFGLVRKSRLNIPEHLHTGIDIKRPSKNYANEPIYPIAIGKVISIRNDGPYANIIIEHELKNLTFWSLYEHVAGITVKVNDLVNPKKSIARFMNRNELNKNGWQFDHFHLEILKIKPMPLKSTAEHPSRFFNSYSLTCYNKKDLYRYYYNPKEFFEKYLNNPSLI